MHPASQDWTEVPPPVHLADPTTDKAPEPTPGCDVCAALAGQWRQATERGSPAYDPSHAVDLAVELRRHPHARVSR